MIVTGSWDKTIKYWDMRQATSVCSIDCQDRVYAMDVNDRLLVVATADRYINAINLDQPEKWYATIQSPLKQQTRAISCFKQGDGYMVGSIEGRCAFQYLDAKNST
jgi:mRNA export factor